MLGVINLGLIILNVFLLKVIMLNVFLLKVIMLNVIMLSVFMLNVIMLNFMAPTVHAFPAWGKFSWPFESMQKQLTVRLVK